MPHVLILAHHRTAAAERLVDGITSQLRERIEPDDSIERVTAIHRIAAAIERGADVVLAPLAYEGEGAFRAAVTAVRSLAPELPIVACCDVSVSAEAILAASAARVSHFAFPAVDDMRAVVRAVVSPTGEEQPGGAVDTRAGDSVEELLAALPLMASRLLLATLSERPARTVADLAAVVGLGERTLARRCARRLWPSPTQILRYGKLLRGLRVALVTGSLEEGAAAAECGSGDARAVAYFRARLADATNGAITQPLTDGLAPLCAAVARAFAVDLLDAEVAAATRARRQRARARARNRYRARLTADGVRLEERGEDRPQGAERPELERAPAGVPLQLRPQRAG